MSICLYVSNIFALYIDHSPLAICIFPDDYYRANENLRRCSERDLEPSLCPADNRRFPRTTDGTVSQPEEGAYIIVNGNCNIQSHIQILAGGESGSKLCGVIKWNVLGVSSV